MRLWWDERTDVDRFKQAVKDYVERDIKHDGLAAAVLRCKLIALGCSKEQCDRAIGEMMMERATLMSQISPTQRKALVMATENYEGRLHRWPGGYWSDDPYLGQQGPPHRWVGTQTIESLRIRGAIIAIEDSHAKKYNYTVVEITSCGRFYLRHG